jgi:hypothetical protein
VPRLDRRSRGLAMVEIECATEALTPYNTAAVDGIVVRRRDELVAE